MTTETKTLSAALVKALAEIGGATKDADNPFFKSKYADLGSVIRAVKPVLAEHDLAFTQHCQPSESGVIVETVLHHVSGERLSMGSLYVPANKNDAQGFGSAQTYARRYSLQTAFGVPAEDDDGNAAAKAAEQARKDEAASRNGNGHQDKQTQDRDAPFPQGPAKNKTDLKTQGRDLWADVMACSDKETLEVLLISKAPLVEQLKAGLPQWWNGGTRDGEAYEGLGQVIEKLERDFDAIMASGTDWRGNVVRAG